MTSRLAVAGAATGVAYQGTTDAFNGEMSSVGTYAKAATFGAAGGVAARGAIGLKSKLGGMTVQEGTQALAGSARVKAASLKQKVLQTPKMSGEVKSGLAKVGQGLTGVGKSALKPLANEVGAVTIRHGKATKRGVNPDLARRLDAYKTWKESVNISASPTSNQFRRFMGAHRPGSQGVTLYDANTSGFAKWSKQINSTHGNLLTAKGPHDIYAVIERSSGKVLRFGETGRGAGTRELEWQRVFLQEHNMNVYLQPLKTVEGKAAARALETRYIKTYEKLFKDIPSFQKTYH